MYTTRFHAPEVFAALVDRAVKCLKGVKFDTIVFRGFSGAIVGPVVALQLGKPWALVRKKGDNSHSSRVVNFTEREVWTAYNGHSDHYSFDAF